jgi:hypothetical protein
LKKKKKKQPSIFSSCTHKSNRAPIAPFKGEKVYKEGGGLDGWIEEEEVAS